MFVLDAFVCTDKSGTSDIGVLNTYIMLLYLCLHSFCFSWPLRCPCRRTLSIIGRPLRIITLRPQVRKASKKHLHQNHGMPRGSVIEVQLTVEALESCACSNVRVSVLLVDSVHV